MAEYKDNELHIAMFPWLAYGHLKPFFEVSKFLAQKGHRVSFISTPKNLSRLPKHPLINFVELPLPQVDGLPEAAESTSELPIHKVPFLKKAYDKLALPLTQFLQDSDDIAVNWIIHDVICHWVPPLASRLGINSVYFCITTATTLAFMGPPSELLGGRRQKPEDFTVVPDWIDYPCEVVFRLREVVSHWECMDEDAPDFQRLAESIQGCRFVISRTSPEFESQSLSLLRKLYGKPVLPVGFLPPSLQENIDLINSGDHQQWETIKRWLDANKENSVVYIALGTEVTLNRDLMHKLAYGLEKSELPFIWVVNDRPLVEAKLGSDITPPGFETRVSDRGLVWRGWAPQLGILAHPSVGGFVTHCGWSSVIESLGLGKPLILLPGDSADLGLIARLLHGKRIGLEIPRDNETGSFTSESVAELIRRVMVEESGEWVRSNVKAVKEMFGDMDLNNRWLEEFDMCLRTWATSTGPL